MVLGNYRSVGRALDVLLASIERVQKVRRECGARRGDNLRRQQDAGGTNSHPRAIGTSVGEVLAQDTEGFARDLARDISLQEPADRGRERRRLRCLQQPEDVEASLSSSRR